MYKFETIITLLVAVLGFMAVVMPFVIEFIKNMIGEAKIISAFGNLERFSAIATALVSVIIYVILYILVPEYWNNIKTLQVVVIGFIFTFSCAMASQIGYDKIIKWIINKK